MRADSGCADNDFVHRTRSPGLRMRTMDGIQAWGLVCGVWCAVGKPTGRALG